MRQLTNAEKQQLEGKIKKEQERQQTLREKNPDLPESFEEASAKTRPAGKIALGKIALRYFWKYGLLGLILCLLAYNVFRFLTWHNFGSNRLINLNVLIALMLLFNHIGFNFTKIGQKSRVMKIVACVWIVLVFAYLYWAWVA